MNDPIKVGLPDDFDGCPEPPPIACTRYPDVHALREEYAAILIKELAMWIAEGGVATFDGIPYTKDRAVVLLADQLAKDVIKLREQPE
jgi:hypothetical protein